MPASAPASCSSTTASVLPASRSASDSPTQTIAPRPAASAARAFLPTPSLLSPKNCRRSLWPTITQLAPASASRSAETSPVRAPRDSQWQSCPQVAIGEPSSRLATAWSAVNTGATPTATPLTAPSWFLSSVTRFSDSAIVLWSFQLPTTNGVRMARCYHGRARLFFRSVCRRNRRQPVRNRRLRTRDFRAVEPLFDTSSAGRGPGHLVLAAPGAGEHARRVGGLGGGGAGQLDDALELGGDQRAHVERAGVAVQHDVGPVGVDRDL